MSLLDDPPTRERTYVEGMPVDPNDLNAIQDKLIELHSAGATGWFWMSPIDGEMFDTEVDYANASLTSTGASGGAATFRLTLPQGVIVKTIAVRAKGDSVAQMGVRLMRFDDGSEDTLEQIGPFIPTGAYATETQAVSPEVEVEAGKSYYLSVDLGVSAAGTLRVGAIGYELARAS